MPKKHTPGLFKRGKIWHVEKQVLGCRLRESTGESNVTKAEQYLAKRMEDIRQASVYGVRPKRTFRQAAIKFLAENQHKRSIREDALHFRILDKYIGVLTLETVHMGSLQPFIQARRQQGVKNRTINYGLQVVRHTLNLAASEWMDEHGLTWLAIAPKIKLLPLDDARLPNPLSWDEQQRFFHELPTHLERMALFAVNTGCRNSEICALEWQWEVHVPKLNTSLFIIPRAHVKNKTERLVVLNRIAYSVIESVRGQHPQYVFAYQGHRIGTMLNSAWNSARKRVEMDVRAHDLKHTFGRRLRAAGVSFEDRQDLLGHKSSRITTHHSGAELSNLMAAADKICATENNIPALVLLKNDHHHKIHTVGIMCEGQKSVTT